MHSWLSPSQAAFETVIEPVLSSYAPDLVIVSAGFDAVRGDPLGGCCLTPQGYAHMTQRLMKHASGRIVLALEGALVTCSLHGWRGVVMVSRGGVFVCVVKCFARRCDGFQCLLRRSLAYATP